MINEKKYSGFTLIELVTVLAILAIIAIITYPAIGDIIDNNENKLYKEQVSRIESAALDYIIEKTEDVSCVSVDTLKKEGFLKNTEIANPKSEEKMNGSVLITNAGGKYKAKYQDASCGGV